MTTRKVLLNFFFLQILLCDVQNDGMDAKLLHNLIDALKAAGRSINEDFVPVLYDSLIQLQSENHFHSVYLWGRVETLSDDYYVAYGHGHDPIEGRTFFYT